MPNTNNNATFWYVLPVQRTFCDESFTETILIKHAPNDVSRMSAESLDQESLEIFTIYTTKHHITNAIYTAGVWLCRESK